MCGAVLPMCLDCMAKFFSFMLGNKLTAVGVDAFVLDEHVDDVWMQLPIV